MVPLRALSISLALWGQTKPPTSRSRCEGTTLWAASKMSKILEFGTEEFWSFCSENRRKETSSENERILLDCLATSQGSIEWNRRDCSSMGDGCTILHHACMNGFTEMVKACLENGADPNLATFTYESTPLKWAASRGNDEIVNLLLNAGADQDRRDYFGYTPLQYACLSGSPKVVSTMLDLDLLSNSIDDTTSIDDRLVEDTSILNRFSTNEDVNAIDETGFMPLHVACSLGRIDVITTLLELGALADEPTEEGRTPLFFAAGCGHDEVIELLLEWGAYMHACTNIEKTFYHVATPGWTPLHEACEKNQLSCVKLLLGKGAETNVFNDGKETPLMIAVQHEHYELAKLLLEKGADINLGDDWNTTPLHTAARQKYERLVSFLIEQDADVDACNNYNETPLHHACWLGWTNIGRILVDSGANVNARNKDNQSPMDYARQRGHASLVNVLGQRISK